MKRTVRCLAHVPGVVLDDDSVVCWGGRLVTIPFEEWLTLEAGGWNYQRERSHYDHTAPVFFERYDSATYGKDLLKVQKTLLSKPKRGTPLDGAMRRTTRRVDTFHGSLLLTDHRAITPPTCSTCYAQTEPYELRGRSIGVLGRQPILSYDGPRVQIDESDAQLVSAFAELLWDSRKTLPNVHEALRGLVRTSRPEFDSTNRIVHLVSTLERLVLPAGARPGAVAATFSARAASLAADTDQAAAALVPLAKQVYAVRSDVLHGRDSHREDAAGLELSHALLAGVIRACVVLWDQHGRPRDFTERLNSGLEAITTEASPGQVRGRLAAP